MEGMMTQQEKSWILYDVANSAFVLIVTTTLMPIFFKTVAAKGMPAVDSTAYWGYANSAAALVLAFMSPVIGAFADYKDRKKRFLSFFLFVGIASTLLLTLVGEGDWILCLAIFILSWVGWAGANLFYDSLLADVADTDRADWISSCGYAWGYIGSVIPFLVVIGVLFIGKSQAGSGPVPLVSARIAFVAVAVWWLAFSIPLLKNVRQRFFIDRSEKPVAESLNRLRSTFRDIRRYKNIFLFLVAYFFYIDGVNTIIKMSMAFGLDEGLGEISMILAILMIQIVSFPFALLYGRLADRFSTKTMLFAGIGVYMVITLIGFFLHTLPSHFWKTVVFWILAFLVGTSMGGIQALSRSFFIKLIPSERSAEFFGFYNIFGKFATIAGPFLMGATGSLFGHSRYGIMSILILFVIGAAVLAKVKTGD